MLLGMVFGMGIPWVSSRAMEFAWFLHGASQTRIVTEEVTNLDEDVELELQHITNKSATEMKFCQAQSCSLLVIVDPHAIVDKLCSQS